MRFPQRSYLGWLLDMMAVLAPFVRRTMMVFLERRNREKQGIEL